MQEVVEKCRNTLIRTTIKGNFAKSLGGAWRTSTPNPSRILMLGLLLNVVLLSVPVASFWSGHSGFLQPKVSIDYVHGPLTDTLKRFKGNTTRIDNFKIVVEDGTALFVGGT